ncbi:MAG: hypothetical protein ABJF11_15280 [Reichenbachiella sp.]|uniref:hypothetical protein n=1 Tax=Reichenbachiella sp. TaxID=2184521 RepID=UPI003267A5E0
MSFFKQSRLKITTILSSVVLIFALIGLCLVSGVINPFHYNATWLKVNSSFDCIEDYSYEYPEGSKIDRKDFLEKSPYLIAMTVAEDGSIRVGSILKMPDQSDSCRIDFTIFANSLPAAIPRKLIPVNDLDSLAVTIKDKREGLSIFFDMIGEFSDAGFFLKDESSYASFSKREINLFLSLPDFNHRLDFYYPSKFVFDRGHLNLSYDSLFDKNEVGAIQRDKFYIDGKGVFGEVRYYKFTYVIEDLIKWENILIIFLSSLVGLGIGGLFEVFLSYGVITQVKRQLNQNKQAIRARKKYKTSSGQKSRNWRRK